MEGSKLEVEKVAEYKDKYNESMQATNRHVGVDAGTRISEGRGEGGGVCGRPQRVSDPVLN